MNDLYKYFDKKKKELEFIEKMIRRYMEEDNLEELARLYYDPKIPNEFKERIKEYLKSRGCVYQFNVWWIPIAEGFYFYKEVPREPKKMVRYLELVPMQKPKFVDIAYITRKMKYVWKTKQEYLKAYERTPEEETFVDVLTGEVKRLPKSKEGLIKFGLKFITGRYEVMPRYLVGIEKAFENPEKREKVLRDPLYDRLYHLLQSVIYRTRYQLPDKNDVPKVMYVAKMVSMVSTVPSWIRDEIKQIIATLRVDP